MRRVNHDAGVVEDIFREIAMELEYPRYYSAEAFYYLRGVYRNGVDGSRFSPVVLSAVKAPVTAESIFERVFEYFQTRFETPQTDPPLVTLKNYVPAMPLNAAPGVVVHNFGTITDVFDRHAIYPIGYSATVSIDGRVVDVSIHEGPVFRVDAAGTVAEAESIEEVGGDEVFGLNIPLVIRFIQMLPNADKCAGYEIWTFDTSAYSLSKEKLILRPGAKVTVPAQLIAPTPDSPAVEPERSDTDGVSADPEIH